MLSKVWKQKAKLYFLFQLTLSSITVSGLGSHAVEPVFPKFFLVRVLLSTPTSIH